MSNILKNTFAVMEEIKKKPTTQEINRVISDLNNSSITDGNLGYQARHLYRQFLGYLFVYQKRNKINADEIMKIEEISDDKLRKIEYGHNYISYINKQCLASLSLILPAAYPIIDPYWEISRNLRINILEKPESESINKLVQSFQLRNSFKIIQNRINLIPEYKNLKEQDAINAFYSIREKIKQLGLNGSSRDFSNSLMTINNKEPESILLSIIFSLIDIHSALMVIDQLLFQAFTSEKFICLDESNIFSIPHYGSNILSNIIEVKTDQVIFKTGEVILIKLPENELPDTKMFCFVENIKLNFSQDFGNESTVGMRCIDDSASIYANMAQQIKEI